MIRDICTLIGFDDASIACFEDTYQKICASDKAVECLETAREKMFEGGSDFKDYLRKIPLLSGTHPYTTNMVFWIFCAEPLRERYKKAGLTDDFCLESLRDFVTKNNECLKLHGVPGMITDWFQMYFTLERFSFGRLQFDIKKWEFDDYNKYLKKGGRVFGCHIPSTGPLYEEAVMDSLKRLYAFAKERNLTEDGILPVYCATWLLYTPMTELLGENSNIRKFHNLFDIIEIRHREGNFSENPRIFYKEYDGPESLKDLPEDTSLQRILKKYYLEGGHQGVGVGVILFDGEEIINK